MADMRGVKEPASGESCGDGSDVVGRIHTLFLSVLFCRVKLQGQDTSGGYPARLLAAWSQ